MLVSRENILSVIPQRPPIVMVDQLLYTDDTTTRCGFEVRGDNMFASDGVLTEPGLVENIAQTAAAGVGYVANQTNERPPVGYIGSIKDLEIFSLPRIGELLVTEISLVTRVFDVTVVKGTIFCNDSIAASCEMKIFISKQA